MNFQKLMIVLLFACSLFVGCDAPPEETNAKIDKGVEGAKEFLDLLGDKSKEIMGDKELQSKLKDILKDLEGEGKDLAKILEEKGGDFKEEIEKLKDDPEFKEKLKDLEKDGKEILEKFEGILKSLEKE